MSTLVSQCPLIRMFELCTISDEQFYSQAASFLKQTDWKNVQVRNDLTIQKSPIDESRDRMLSDAAQLGPLVGRIHKRIAKCPFGSESVCCKTDTIRHKALSDTLKALRHDISSSNWVRDTTSYSYPMWKGQLDGTIQGHYHAWKHLPMKSLPKQKRKYFVESDPNEPYCRAVIRQQRHPPHVWNMEKEQVAKIPQELWPVGNRDYERLAFCKDNKLALRHLDDDYRWDDYQSDLRKLDGFYRARKERLLQEELDNLRTILLSLKKINNPIYSRVSTRHGRWHLKNYVRRKGWQYLLGANQYVLSHSHLAPRYRRRLNRPPRIPGWYEGADEIKHARAKQIAPLSTQYPYNELYYDRNTYNDLLDDERDDQWMRQNRSFLVGVELNPGPKYGDNRNRRPRQRKNPLPQSMAIVPYVPSETEQSSVVQPFNKRKVPLKKKKEKNIGGQIGKKIGKGMYNLFANMTGFGDYAINANTLMDGGMNPPQVVNSFNNGGFIVRHREYLRDINATTAFTLTSLNINPGLVASFPWLAAVADQFEQYRFRGLVFEFKSLSSDAVLSSSTSSALGSVVMATQYDVLDPPFPNKFNMENYEFANSNKPSISFYHPIECARNQTTITEQYVRSGSVPAGADQRFYDLGTFNLATVGMQAASGVCGELWCTYEIELLKPKLTTDEGYSLLTDHYRLGTASSAQPFGITSVLAAGSSIGGTFNTNGTIYNFPSFIVDGNYLVLWSVIGGSVTLVNPAISSPGNGLSILAYWNNDTGGSVLVPNTTITTTAIIGVIVKILAPSAQLAFSGTGTLPTSITGGDLWVTQINANITSLSKGDEIPTTTFQSEDDVDVYPPMDPMILKLLELVPREQLIQFAQNVLN
jgi:hypothetical protein